MDSLKYLIGGIWKQILKIYFFLKPFCSIFVMKFCYKETIRSAFDIPIIINNRNRLQFLKELLLCLSSRGYENIYILDNDSTYPPLIDFYSQECFFKVYKLGKNLGHLALWESGIIDQFKNDYFVYTDPDILIDQNCPSNFMEVFLDILKKYPLVEKVGFSLRIDDLPDTFDMKQQVVNWEKQFWKKKIADNPPLYKAAIDTTFALYRPYYLVGGHLQSPNIRVGEPYIAKHMPWYNDSSNLSEEEIYYIQHSETSTHWTTGKMK